MSVFDFAALAVAAVTPVLGEWSMYAVKATGATLRVRAIPDSDEREMPGQEGRTMFRDRRNFLVAVSDFGSVIPTSGDVLTVRGERWRVAQADQIHPAAPMWSLQCQQRTAS